MQYCVKCRAQLMDTAEYCPACGTPVPKMTAPGQGAQPGYQGVPQGYPGVPQQGYPGMPQQARPQPGYQGAPQGYPGMPQQARPQQGYQGAPQQNPQRREPEQSSNSSKTIIIILIAIIILGIAGFLAWYFLGNGGGASSKSGSASKTQTTQAADQPATQPVTQPATTAPPATQAATTAPAPTQAPGEEYLGTWYLNGNTLTVSRSGNGYAVNIDWQYGNTREGWTTRLSCTESDGSLQYSDGTFNWYTYGRGGGNQKATQSCSGYSGRFTFFSNAKSANTGNAVFTRDGSGTGEGLLWEKWAGNLPSDDYYLWYSSQIPLTDADLEGFSKEDLRYARNEIYARNGRKFKDDELQSYFNSKSWYRGTISADSFNDNMLSQVERDNVKFIKAKEDSMQ